MTCKCNEWQMIDESVPKEQLIIGYCPKEEDPYQKMIYARFQMIIPIPRSYELSGRSEECYAWSFRQDYRGGKGLKPTHWMPLPKPPIISEARQNEGELA